jgi:hypothetical protein
MLMVMRPSHLIDHFNGIIKSKWVFSVEI